MANVEESDVAAECEYRKEKGVAKWHEKFLVDIFAFLENFRPSSVDPERLFSLCRLSRNYLQNRLSPENHSRNVFLNKNKRFLK